MRKKIVAIIITVICLSGCGNTPAVSNDVSKPVSDVTKTTESAIDISETSEAAMTVSQPAEGEIKSDEELVNNEKAALYDKYADICDCLENKDYDKAIEFIETMKPEPSTETIPITLDNWATYFSQENEINPLTKNGYGEIIESSFEVVLRLKPEYREKLVSLSGEIGYECVRVPHIVTNIDKATGFFDTELVESGPVDTEDPICNVSTTHRLDYKRGGIEIDIAKRADPHGLGLRGSNIIIYGAEEAGPQYLYYPEEINIIRINGELVLSK